MKLTCGEGNHTEIIGSDYATCIKCRTVRRITWYQIGHKSYLEKGE